MSKSFFCIFILLIAPQVLSGCGLLPDAKKQNQALSMSKGEGCLNQLGPRVEQFLNGELDLVEWRQTWNCTTDAMDLFAQYARGSVSDGYTREDIRQFTQAVLATDKVITPALVQAVFELKAAAIGGSADVLTVSEYQQLTQLIRTLGKSSEPLLPLLKLRKNQVDTSTLIELHQRIIDFGMALSATLPGETQMSLSEASFRTLLTETSKVFHWNIPSEAALALIRSKLLFVGGPSSAISGNDFKTLLPVAATLGGAALIITSFPPHAAQDLRETAVFYQGLGKILLPTAQSILKINGGRVPLSRVDAILDALPSTWLPIRALVLKNTLRPVTNRILRSSQIDSFGPESLGIIYEWIDQWSRRLSMIDQIFNEAHLNPHEVESGVFAREALRLAAKMNPKDRTDAVHVATLAQRFRPLFPDHEHEITFTRDPKNNRYNLEKIAIYQIITDILMKAYSRTPAADRADASDILKLITDFIAFGQEIKWLGDFIPGSEKRRLAEADLFGFLSNGDGWVDLNEGTSYLAFASSIGYLSERIRAVTEEHCKYSDRPEDQDLLGWRWQRPDCFREHFYANVTELWNREPGLLNEYLGMNSKDRLEKIEIPLEVAARRYGYSSAEKPMLLASSDIAGFAGTLQFLEATFVRFDENGDETLNTNETLAEVPLYRSLIQEIMDEYLKGTVLESLRDSPAVIDAAFTYTLHFGAPPQTVGDYGHFVLWFIARPFWNLNVSRSGIYQLLPILFPAPAPPPGADR